MISILPFKTYKVCQLARALAVCSFSLALTFARECATASIVPAKLEAIRLTLE
jgi:hypothetical protein